MTAITLDQNQQRFRDLTVKGAHPVVCSTVAGGGKTAMQVQTFGALLKSGVKLRDIQVACYNRSNRVDLTQKMGLPENSPVVKTYDGLAYSIVADQYGYDYETWHPRHDKFKHILTYLALDCYASTDGNLTAAQWQEVEMAEALLTMCMNTLTDPSDWSAVERLVDLYGLEMPEEKFAKVALSVALACGKDGLPTPYKGKFFSLAEGFTFPQLLWMVNKDEEVRVSRRRQAYFVLTDERQDCNKGHEGILNRITTGYQYSVGDKDQTLYYFLGASIRGWERLLHVVDTVIVDSPITYRCPEAVVEFAQQYVPRLTAAPGAKKGRLVKVSPNCLYRELTYGDVWVTKTNAAAISGALRCILRGMRAYVKGRNIGEGLKEEFNKIAKVKGFQFMEFLQHLESHLNQTVHLLKIRLRDPDRQISKAMDTKRSLEALYAAAVEEGVRDEAVFRVYIDRLFSDDEDLSKAVLFSTIWKFKGFENRRVFMYEQDTIIPSAASMRGWEIEQSRHASYVGVTRSLDTLLLVGGSGMYDTSDPDFI